jgi:hypothetical protein
MIMGALAIADGIYEAVGEGNQWNALFVSLIGLGAIYVGIDMLRSANRDGTS